MKKNIKYILFLFVCLCTLPLVTKAYYDFGTLAPGASASGSYAWWDFNECTANKTGPYTFTPRQSYYTAKDSYYRFMDIQIDDYVDKDYTDIVITCKVKDDPNHPIQSGRVTSWTSYTFTFDIAAGGEALPVENPKSYYLHKGDSINLKNELSIQRIESFTQSVGSELGTISYSNCSGTNACTINFSRGTPLQDREHKFTMVYVATNGVRYRSVVTVYEMDTKKTIDLGNIDPTETVYGDFLEGVSNFSCSNSTTSVPAVVTRDGSGTKYRVKVTSSNTSLNAYNGKAVCTFKMDGKDYEYTYNYKLNKNNPETLTKEYEKYPAEVVDIYSDLSIARIISVSPNYNADALQYTGCVANATSCKVTMKADLTEGRANTFLIYYYDTSNKFKLATVKIIEKSTTVSASLGIIGVGNTASVSIPASSVTCAAADANKPFTPTLEEISTNQSRLSIKNINKTVNTYSNLTYSCTGYPPSVGGKMFTYIYTFTLSSETTPIVNYKSYEMFPSEVLDFKDLYSIKEVRSYTHSTGRDAGTIRVDGCSGTGDCKALFMGTALHNRRHEISITYVNNADVLYTTNVTIVEKDPAITTKAYPGVLGFCEFNSDWELASWADTSGKNYSYYEAKVRNAVLPNCIIDPDSNREKLPLVFKGWTKGYRAGDALTTKTTCGTDLAPAGSASSLGQTYAPCYEMTPHIRVSTNSGVLVDAPGFELRSDMTYIKMGSSFTERVKLPNVEYTGFYSTSYLTGWKNSSTGEVKAPGTEVVLDGTVWIAISDRTVTQVDLYKTVGLNETVQFSVPKMTSCYLESGSPDNVLVNDLGSGDCKVTGQRVTEFDVYSDVVVTLEDGSVRVYKFSVEDRSHITDFDNGHIFVDVDDDIDIGKTDDKTLNDFNTDQCTQFFISRNEYVKYTFANARANNGFGEIEMNTGIYKVYQLCPDDYSTYVALCLDPGRRGPNESNTGTEEKTFKYKGSTVTVRGNEYKKEDDIQRDTEFGKLVMHIVKSYDIKNFDLNSGTVLYQRAAAHVAVRSMAIHTGYSRSPDPAEEVYASHYYPYLGVATGIGEGLADGDIDYDEAKSAVKDAKNGNGFINWQDGVDGLVIDLLTDYGGSDTSSESEGFSRTIDKTESNSSGNSYSITYEGKITAPTGAEATMKVCRNADDYGVECIVNTWDEIDDTAGRKTYKYNVTIKVADATTVKPPTNTDEEKDLSFQIEYTGGADIVNAFIASSDNSSYNLQRMLIISTTNPKVYIYFSVLPPNCDLPVLDAEKCSDETECITNINNKSFNAALYKAAGCCRYEMNEASYLFKSVCAAECTSSTMTSVCDYVANGKEKADLYEIKEGSQYKSEVDGYQNAIGTCVVNVSDYYVNDNANFLSTVDPSKKFTKYDDASNLINVKDYDDNRYCQVTCKEDWQLSMDSFGNFLGENAVAAGTYFQIVSNDMFMSGQRTCYTTFINYDRFMSNLVDLSNELVQAYNRYSRWSHVWTDIDKQIPKKWDGVDYFSSGDSGQGVLCVEYFDKCPQGTTDGDYYWSAGAPGTKKCRMVPNYQSGATGSGATGANCVAKPDTNKGEDYTDGIVSYKTTGEWNSDSTYCSFNRWTCDQYKDAHEEDWMDYSTKTCYYYTYYTKESKKQGSYNQVCTPNASGGGETCEPCDTGYYLSDGKCKENTPSGWSLYSGYFYKNCSTGYTSYNTYYCQNNTASTYSASKYELTMAPNYNLETLKCKVWGKGYDYGLKTENEIVVPNSDGEDIYYKTEEFDKEASEGYDDRDSIANAGDNSVDNNRQNIQEKDKDVKDNYKKEYLHDCTLVAALYQPGAKGSSSCKQVNLDDEEITVSTYDKTNEMFCEDNKYANLSDDSLDKAFCKVNDDHTDNKTDAPKTYEDSDYKHEENAFNWITEKFKDHAKKELDNARFTMQDYYNQIYDHAHDLFSCQNFQLKNTTDYNDSRANNSTPTGKIMGKEYNYVEIPTQFAPYATYDYDEGYFMDRVPKEDRYLEQYMEKNEGVFSTHTKVDGEAKNDTDSCGSGYKDSTDCKVEIEIELPDGSKEKTWLARNYVENNYYNPVTPWLNIVDPGETDIQVALDRVNNYHDPRYEVSTPAIASKKIVVCTVGVINNGTDYWEGKEGEFVAYTSTTATPEWLGGRCYQITVNYQRVHYVKSSIQNSSYYKNKGYWYVRGGDTKIHGNDIEDAIKKFNNLSDEIRQGVKFEENNDDEKARWSRLGSFNVFPISMSTPRNIYTYTYQFGGIGSYYGDGDLGRIMGNGEKSIIPQNKRTCVYEVYEEVCLCCGYAIDSDEIVEQIANGHGPSNDYKYDLSTPDGYSDGNITFYSNTVSLGDLDLGRNDQTLGTNWSDEAPFMYNGHNMTTDKGDRLKTNIEANGEKIYSSTPEYAFVLNPDSLKQIRSYNDVHGYDLDLRRLKVYDAKNIACDSSNNCNKDGSAETISFQHYGSLFLEEELVQFNVDRRGLVYEKGLTNVCYVEDSQVDASFDMAQEMINGKCRWVDFIEKDQTYYDPITRQNTDTWFRLSFK